MLNVLDFVLLNLTFLIVVLGSLISNCMPVALIKFYRYGSFGYKGGGAKFLQSIELPKSYYRHYYVFSVISTVTLIYMLFVHFFGIDVNEHIKSALKTIFNESEAAGDHNRDTVRWWDAYTKVVLPCVILFLLASYEQYASNIILANLRKDKRGSVVTKEHKIPRDRMFEKVSSPHRLCEIVLYAALAIILPTRTMFIIWSWVAGNQIQCAVHAHQWYEKKGQSGNISIFIVIKN